MKNIFLLSLCLMTAPLAMAQEFTINGNIIGVKSATVEVCTMTDDTSISASERRFSIKKPVEQTKFSVTAKVNEPSVVRIGFFGDRRLKKKPSMKIMNSMCLWAVVKPGDVITANGLAYDHPNTYVRGDYENDAMADINSSYFPALNAYVNMDAKSYGKDYRMIKDKEAFNKKMTELYYIAHDKKVAAVKKNASSIAGLWNIDDMLLREEITPEVAQEMLKTVDKKYFNHSYYISAKERVEAAMNMVVGSKVRNIITKQTKDGSEFDLSSLRGKVVVIDFWGTWCGPCMAGMPKLKEYKEKYSDKLEVVGIAKDTRSKWEKAISNNSMPWIHLLNGTDEDNFVSKFAVNGFPTKYIISKKGLILYITSGENEEFYQKLDEILK